ncbi:glycerophosphodiester phosphodiesterase [Peptostreptococcus faecalis]|uniref:glycerophosphodiester phosphodiesterase n=1 Tax=Peptostreptococcus faecalis TaxID=2045015 RepID=UPI000C7CBC9E|nr:glycerophosphodiester phosphodiesterase [Peptostreptococcus faecalis]
MDAFRNMRDIFKAMKKNKYEYLMLIVIFQLSKIYIVLPVVKLLLNQSMKLVGVEYLTNFNFLQLFKNGFSIALLLVIAFIIGFNIFLELGVYFLIAYYQVNNLEYSFRKIFKRLFYKIKYLLHPSSLLLFLYIGILLPLSPIGLKTTYTTGIFIPDFITEPLFEQLPILLGATVATILLLILFLRTIYVIYYFVVEPEISLSKACIKSLRETKGKIKSNLVTLFSSLIYFEATVFAYIFLSLMPVIVTEMFAVDMSEIFAVLSLTAIDMIMLMYIGLGVPFIIYMFVAKLNHDLNSKDEFKYKEVKGASLAKSKVIRVILIIVILISGIGNFIMIKQGITYEPTLVIAHRGYTEDAVENSLESLEAASKVGANMVEIDIQQTKDKDFVVMHDENVKRMTGKSMNVYDSTLKQLQDLEMRQNGYTAKVPSLEEFIDLSKKLNVRILLEIKPTGHESKDMEESLVRMLKEKEIQHTVVIQSLNKDSIDRIKQIDPSIKTCFVIPILIGDVPITDHNYLALEDFSMTSNIRYQAQVYYEGLFVWTVNDESKISSYLSQGVQGIITNHPDIVIKKLSMKENTIFDKISWILNNANFVKLEAKTEL